MRDLITLDRRNAAAVVKAVDNAVSQPARLEKDVRGHGELEVAFADIVSDEEHPVAELDGRGVSDVENSVQIAGKHTGTSDNATSERDSGALMQINAALQFRGVPKRDKIFLPVTFDGMLDRNVPLPTFRLSRDLPFSRGNGRPDLAGRPIPSSMET